jgi:hypothetical protein
MPSSGSPAIWSVFQAAADIGGLIVRDSAGIAEPLRLTPSREDEFFDAAGRGFSAIGNPA